MKKIFYTAIILTALAISSCSHINEDDKKYVGKWQFCYTNDNPIKPIWKRQEVLFFTLDKNGEWSSGNNKGKWGYGYMEHNGKDFYLGFNEFKVLSVYASQIKDLTGKILEIEGVNVLDVAITYSYKDWGSFDHSTEGVTLTPNQQYSDCVHYYYVKTSDESSKILKYFEEEKIKNLFNDITKLLESNEPEDITLDGSSILNLEHIDKSLINKYKEAMYYGINIGRANDKHKRFLDLISGSSASVLDSKISIDSTTSNDNNNNSPE
jgi:hypothetical protein